MKTRKATPNTKRHMIRMGGRGCNKTSITHRLQRQAAWESMREYIMGRHACTLMPPTDFELAREDHRVYGQSVIDSTFDDIGTVLSQHAYDELVRSPLTRSERSSVFGTALCDGERGDIVPVLIGGPLPRAERSFGSPVIVGFDPADITDVQWWDEADDLVGEMNELMINVYNNTDDK